MITIPRSRILLLELFHVAVFVEIHRYIKKYRSLKHAERVDSRVKLNKRDFGFR